jgi:precorrin-2 dehydrogenase/sirohydrochlorin ferrochelatase
MPYYPIFLELEGKKVLVLGGGTVARRKVDTLLEHGARVHIVARELKPPLDLYAEEGKIRSLGKEFEEGMLKGVFMVIAATDNRRLNSKVGKIAQERGLLVNAVDQPSDCNFIVPSVLRRGDLQVAVSTAGKSPAMARRVRQDLEKVLGEEYGLLLLLMGHIRKEVLSRDLSQSENREIFWRITESPILQTLKKADWLEAARILSDILNRDVSAEEVKSRIQSER